MFQSSPSLLAGCNFVGLGFSSIFVGFNPHPAFWLGATKPPLNHYNHREFQSSPSLLAGCNLLPLVNHLFNPVSILTQPFGWVQRPDCPVGRSFWWFQSSPSLLAGCNLFKQVFPYFVSLFQSSPSLLAGCNIAAVLIDDEIVLFQSSPSLLAGCNYPFL
ncbi:hypothetical protein LG52_478 [Geobacillus kaustophilus]|uniref:Uncharacterized protein n=1 Tax=Geobacillus kaustophilus TaxID=1462 RepID=A0A0D8BPZ4_GEOKU|nr:hypothetical protein LG52_478 [Geobacillus kaustophilus]